MLLALKAAGAKRGTTSHPVPHQHLKALGKSRWAEPHCSGSAGESLAALGQVQAKQELPHVPQEAKAGGPCHSMQLPWELWGDQSTKPNRQ